MTRDEMMAACLQKAKECGVWAEQFVGPAPNGHVAARAERDQAVKSLRDAEKLLIALAALATPAPVAAPPADVLDGPRVTTALDREYAKALDVINQQREELDRLRAAPPADLVATCEWSEDASGEWHTGCGTLFVFDTDGPTEHKFGWCYHCGKPLAPVPFLLPEVPK